MAGHLCYGVCAGPTDKFDRLAARGVRQVDPDAPLLVRRDQWSIHAAYNSLIDEAISQGAAGLVLLHDDVLIEDSALPAKVMAAFDDPDVGIVGVIGASDLESVRWWDYDTRGFVQENGRTLDFGERDCEVDAVDGLLIALSPRAMRELRFDEEHYLGFHGYDVEICAQARARGLKVLVKPIDVYHDATPGRITDVRAYRFTDVVWRAKWRPTRALRVWLRCSAHLSPQWRRRTIAVTDKLRRRQRTTWP